MTECGRCGTAVKWDEGKQFDMNGRPHSARNCKTKPGYVWCPKHRALFHENAVCVHYQKYNWEPGQHDDHLVELIYKEYEYGDMWKWREKKDAEKEKICTTCGKPFGALGEKRHMQVHKMHDDGQSNIMEFFS